SSARWLSDYRPCRTSGRTSLIVLLVLLVGLVLLVLLLVHTQLGKRLFAELVARLDLLALLKLLNGFLGFRAPAAVGRTGLEALVIERLLHVPDFTAR